MDDPLCRVTIQCAHTSRAVDLSIPRHAGLGLLIPDIVQLVVGTDPPQAAWRLDRIAGDRCDESRSLHDNGVHDGDVIVLSSAQSAAPGPVPGDACATLAAAGLDPPPPAGSAVVWTFAGMAAAAILVLSGVTGASQPATAILAAVVAAGALRIGMRTGHVWTMLLCVVFAGAAAFLATPGQPGPGHLMLTSAVCASVSVMLLRVSEHGTRLYTAIAAGTTAIAAVTATALALPMDLTTHGATLAVVALGGLAVSGRLALLIGGIRPGRPLSGLHADRARDRLAGLVTGFAVTAAVAAISVAAGAASEQRAWPASAVLIAVIAAVLSLRMRSYADPRCRRAAGWSGLTCATAGFALLEVSVPAHAGWSAVTAFAAAAWYRGRGAPGNPLLTRVGDVVESLASAAVIPLACWAGGVFDLVRSTSLP